MGIISNAWRVFQNKVRSLPFLAKLKVVPQPTLSDGKKPDYVGLDKKDPQVVKAVVDAKDVAVLTKHNINQVADYKNTINEEQAKAPAAAVAIPKRTRVPRKVRAYAKNEDVEIVRHGARQKVRAYA